MDNVKDIIETTLKAEIVKALNSVPEAIDKLVRAALEQKVFPSTGTPQRPQYSYSEEALPYLDYLVGQEIRNAATFAVREAVVAQKPRIKELVAARINAETIVDAFTKEIVGTVERDWQMRVSFHTDKTE